MLQVCHDTIVQTANDLPALPEVVMRLSEIMADPDFRYQDVVAALQLEPVIASRQLQMANSPLYGTGRVTTIHEAAVRLGVDTVRSIALSDVARPSADLDLSAFGMTPQTTGTIRWRLSALRNNYLQGE